MNYEKKFAEVIVKIVVEIRCEGTPFEFSRRVAILKSGYKRGILPNGQHDPHIDTPTGEKAFDGAMKHEKALLENVEYNPVPWAISINPDEVCYECQSKWGCVCKGENGQ